MLSGRMILYLLCLVAMRPAGAAAGAPQGVSSPGPGAGRNTWSARSSTGLTLAGTWTAVAGATGATVTGTWTVFDAEGRTSGRGGWSAAKSSTGWTGAWRATVGGGGTEYSGTWKANVALRADALFAELLESALQGIVSGNWSAGRQSGAWSIRAFK